MLKALQSEEGQRQLRENFPTDRKIATAGYCSMFFLEILQGRGKRVAIINFGDYAAQLKEYGTFKLFLPKK